MKNNLVLFFGIFVTLAAELLTAHAEPIDVKQAKTASGLEFSFVQSAAEDRVALYFFLPRGVAHDQLEGPQTGWVAAGQMFEKAGNIDLNEAIETLADLQAGFGVRVLDETTMGYLISPTEYFDELIELANLFLTDPKLPEDKFERGKRRLIKEQKTARLKPNTKASLAFIGMIGEPHPYANGFVGDPERIAQVTRDDAIKWYQETFVKENLKIAIVGNLDRAEMTEKVERLFNGLAETGPLVDLPLIQPKTPSTNPVTLNVGLGQQALVILGGASATVDDPEAFVAATQLQQILGSGMKSRLFKDVRKETGKTYGIQAQLRNFTQTGVISFFGFIDKDGIENTLAILLDSLKKFREEGPTASEIESVKADAALSDAKMMKDHNSLAWVVASYLHYGCPIEQVRDLPDLIQRIDLSDSKYREAFLPEQLHVLIAN